MSEDDAIFFSRSRYFIFTNVFTNKRSTIGNYFDSMPERTHKPPRSGGRYPITSWAQRRSEPATASPPTSQTTHDQSPPLVPRFAWPPAVEVPPALAPAGAWPRAKHRPRSDRDRPAEIPAWRQLASSSACVRVCVRKGKKGCQHNRVRNTIDKNIARVPGP